MAATPGTKTLPLNNFIRLVIGQEKQISTQPSHNVFVKNSYI